jgi:hypothetical protein
VGAVELLRFRRTERGVGFPEGKKTAPLKKPAFCSPHVRNAFAPGGFFITFGRPQAQGDSPEEQLSGWPPCFFITFGEPAVHMHSCESRLCFGASYSSACGQTEEPFYEILAAIHRRDSRDSAPY